jgi:hypothetical protein
MEESMSLWKFATLFLFVVIVAACAANPRGNTEIKNISPTNSPEAPELTPTEPASGEKTPDVEAPRSPLDPLPNEDNMIRGSAFVQSSEIVMMESYPVQVVLKISGTLPTPCHKLRAEVSELDENNNINVELYSLTEPGAMCIQVLKPFEESIPLGSFESGEYTVSINGKEAGTFSL